MSTLHVENLKGLSSGGNANKIIVPSGHTIDASAGTLVPSAGHVVQVVYNKHTTFDSSADAYVDVVSATFTPKFSNSLILVRYTAQLFKYNSDNLPNSYARIQQEQGGGSYVDIVNHPYITYGGTSFHMYSLSMSAQFTVTNTNSHTVKLQIDPKTHRVYIYTLSNLFTVEEIKQ